MHFQGFGHFIFKYVRRLLTWRGAASNRGFAGPGAAFRGAFASKVAGMQLIK